MSYTVKQLNGKITLGLHLLHRFIGVSGETPTIEIRRIADGKYLDFGSGTWVSSGGTREQIMPERSWTPGLYYFEFDHNVYDQDNPAEYNAIYRNPVPYRLEQVELFSFEDPATPDITTLEADVHRILQHLENDHDLIAHAPSHYEHKVFDDNGATGGTTIHEADITLNGNTEERRKK